MSFCGIQGTCWFQRQQVHHYRPRLSAKSSGNSESCKRKTEFRWFLKLLPHNLWGLLELLSRVIGLRKTEISNFDCDEL